MNYTSLKTAMQNWIHDSSSGYTALLDTFIELGESRINRDYRSPRLIKSATGTIASTISFPADYQEIVSFSRVDSSTSWTALKQISVDGMRAGQIGYCFTVSGISVSPGVTGTYELVYFPKLLSVITNTTNQTMQNHPDVYLYACLLEAAAYTRDEREQYFFEKYKSLMAEANASEQVHAQSLQMRSDVYVA